ncbi:hypothetical protein [Microbacterium paludicola]|uniref:hypothetical protein n=1 Tax=Microbacterium paludicola TaxID=300019 RepID=UPI0021B649BB|nr:hypothetical protein [Microbacterium paludicola]
MMVLFGTVFSGTETPIPTPSMTVDPNSVTPGPAGFAVIVIVVLAVVLLIWDMNRRVRRVRYRSEVREELDAEQAASPDAAGPATDAPDSATDARATSEDDTRPPA